jgi:uncharacterized protein YbbC (DUF1343 family)
MLRAELNLELDLRIVRMEGWRREDYFEATGLPWVNPSPNMRSLTQAILYPGIGLLEFTNLSVGRGTPTPFELFGAPWLDGRRFAEALHGENLPGVRFRAIAFVPESSKFAEVRCGGVRIVLTDRESFRPVRTGLTIARLLREMYPNDWEADRLDTLLRNKAVRERVLAGVPAEDIERDDRPALDTFLKRRSRHLLY